MVYIVKPVKSPDGISTKYVQSTDDSQRIETLYVNQPNKHIICYSTQIGCDCHCKFCYVGRNCQLIRNLTRKEIVEQCENVIADQHLQSVEKPILFSAMGMGEPLMNLDDYIKSIRQLAATHPVSKFALATSGRHPALIVELGRRLRSITNEIQSFKLSISLHATGDLRKYLMPASADIESTKNAVNMFKKISGFPVEYYVTMIKYVTDSADQAYQMAKILCPTTSVGDMPYIKLNRYNPIPGCDFERSPLDRVMRFKQILEAFGYTVEYYETDGSDIGGSCGQILSEPL